MAEWSVDGYHEDEFRRVRDFADMRDGAYAPGAIEIGMMNSAVCQMARFYNVPSGGYLGLTLEAIDKARRTAQDVEVEAGLAAGGPGREAERVAPDLVEPEQVLVDVGFDLVDVPHGRHAADGEAVRAVVRLRPPAVEHGLRSQEALARQRRPGGGGVEGRLLRRSERLSPGRLVLARALHHHLEHRVLTSGNKTIIFD